MRLPGTREMSDFNFPSFSHQHNTETGSVSCESHHDHHKRDWLPRFLHATPGAAMDDVLPLATRRRSNSRDEDDFEAYAHEAEERPAARRGRRPIVVEEYLEQYGDSRFERRDDVPRRGRYEDDRPVRRSRGERYDDFHEERPVRRSRARSVDRYDDRYDDERPVRARRGGSTHNAPAAQGGWSSKAILMALGGAAIAFTGVFFGFASVAEIARQGQASLVPGMIGLVGGVCATGIGGTMIGKARSGF